MFYSTVGFGEMDSGTCGGGSVMTVLFLTGCTVEGGGGIVVFGRGVDPSS